MRAQTSMLHSVVTKEFRRCECDDAFAQLTRAIFLFSCSHLCGLYSSPGARTPSRQRGRTGSTHKEFEIRAFQLYCIFCFSPWGIPIRRSVRSESVRSVPFSRLIELRTTQSAAVRNGHAMTHSTRVEWCCTGHGKKIISFTSSR